jgi:hypothetical protein
MLRRGLMALGMPARSLGSTVNRQMADNTSVVGDYDLSIQYAPTTTTTTRFRYNRILEFRRSSLPRRSNWGLNWNYAKVRSRSLSLITWSDRPRISELPHPPKSQWMIERKTRLAALAVEEPAGSSLVSQV